MSVAVIFASGHFAASAMAMQPVPVPKSKALVGTRCCASVADRQVGPTIQKLPAEFGEQFRFRSGHERVAVHGNFISAK